MNILSESQRETIRNKFTGLVSSLHYSDVFYVTESVEPPSRKNPNREITIVIDTYTGGDQLAKQFEQWRKNFGQSVEKAIADATLTGKRYQSHLYLCKCAELLNQLDINTNSHALKIFKKLVLGVLSYKNLIQLLPKELDPSKWIDVENKIKKKYAYMYSTSSTTISMFKCNKCDKWECDYCIRQERSADEPATYCITCRNCGNRWKMNR